MDTALSFESAAQGVKSLQFKENFSVIKFDKLPAFQQNKCAPFVQKEKRQEAKTYSEKACYRCLKHHDPKECPFKNAECFTCKIPGYIKAACCLRKASTAPKKNYKRFKIKTLQEQFLNYMKVINNGLSFVKAIIINGGKNHLPG